MRKPIAALGLCLTAGLGAIPVADALAATSSSSSLPSPSSTSRANNGVSAAAIIGTAMKYIGYPYTATGNSPATGFSCIGFVSYVYRQNGIPLPDDLQDAYAYAPKVAFSNLEPGDVLFFQNTVWPGISHTAIYLGGGRFIHAEWYNRGVVTSSFTNDPVDGNYWTQHYLGANRPWTGAAEASTGTAKVTQPHATSTAIPTAAVASVQTPLTSHSNISVRVTALNVRSGPSLQASVSTVISLGTSLVIRGHQGNWYQVELPDRVVGWVIASGIGMGGGASRTSALPTPTAGTSTSTHPTIGAPTSPKRASTRPGLAAQNMVRVTVNGLRIHIGPALSSQVIGSVNRNQTLVVVTRTNNWVKIRLPSGSAGWISAQFAQAENPHLDYAHQP
jgi:SH3-like domain-containing protein